MSDRGDVAEVLARTMRRGGPHREGCRVCTGESYAAHSRHPGGRGTCGAGSGSRHVGADLTGQACAPLTSGQTFPKGKCLVCPERKVGSATSPQRSSSSISGATWAETPHLPRQSRNIHTRRVRHAMTRHSSRAHRPGRSRSALLAAYRRALLLSDDDESTVVAKQLARLAQNLGARRLRRA